MIQRLLLNIQTTFKMFIKNIGDYNPRRKLMNYLYLMI